MQAGPATFRDADGLVFAGTFADDDWCDGVATGGIPGDDVFYAYAHCNITEKLVPSPDVLANSEQVLRQQSTFAHNARDCA